MGNCKIAAAAAALGLALTNSSLAAIIQIDQSSFTAGAGLITFSESPLGTQNPIYTPANYGGGPTSPTVTFGGFFVGQSAGATNPSACPAGAAITGCVLGSPISPL